MSSETVIDSIEQPQTPTSHRTSWHFNCFISSSLRREHSCFLFEIQALNALWYKLLFNLSGKSPAKETMPSLAVRGLDTVPGFLGS